LKKDGGGDGTESYTQKIHKSQNPKNEFEEKTGKEPKERPRI
jgi:hypothetical protein